MLECPSDKIRLGIGEACVGLHAHIAFFWETSSDFAAALGFLEEGLNGTDHCVLFGHQRANLEACRILAGKGFDLDRLQSEGRLVLVGPAETGDATLDSIGRTITAQLKRGAQVIRLLGNIGWLEQGWPGIGDLVAMETKVSAVAEQLPCVVLCMYDLRSLPALIIRHGALQSHALVMQDGSLKENEEVASAEAVRSQLDAKSQALQELQREREAAQLYRGAFANLQDGLVIVRVDESRQDASPTVVDANRAARIFSSDATARFAGAPAGQHFAGLFDSKLVDACRRAVQTASLVDAGEIRWADNAFYRVKVFPLIDGYAGVLVTETTERKRTEEALLSLRNLGNTLQSTVNFERILDTVIQEAISIVGAENGSVCQCCAEGFASYRYFVDGQLFPGDYGRDTGQEVPGHVVTHAGPCLSNDALNDPRVDAGRAAREGVRTALKVPIMDPGGDMIGYLEMHNKKDPSGFTSFDQEQLTSVAQIASHAIKNAKAFQKIALMGIKLRESQARFRSTFEGAGIGIALMDREGRPVQSNPALQALLGYSSEELAGLQFAQFTHPEDAGRDLEKYRDLMAGRIERYQMEKRLIHKSGREIWVTLTASAVDDEQGTPQYAIGMVEDITERKRGETEIALLLHRVQRDAMELERRVAERTAQLQEINEELDTFAYSVSHDLRAPLRAIESFVEILLENKDLAKDPERGAFLERILAAARGMDRLVRDLLAFSRLSRQEVVLQTVELAQVVRDAVEQLQLSGEGGSYHLEVIGELPRVPGNHLVLVQVVLNLLSNGIKYVAKGVTPELRVWAEQDEHKVRLFVQDNGIGIAPEHQERIFKVFERLHGVETYQGTGVGLAIVRRAAARLGGSIGVESSPGQGSRFWVELPRSGKYCDE